MEPLEKICRICMKSSVVLTPLFNDNTLSRKIREISFVKVTKGDNLPSKICVHCVVNINSAFDFRQTLIDNDAILKERVAKLLNKDSFEVAKSEELFGCEEDFGEAKLVIKTEIFNCMPDESSFLQDYTQLPCKTEVLTPERSPSPPYEDVFIQDNESKIKVEVVTLHKKKHFATKYAKSDRHVLCHCCGKQVLWSNFSKHVLIHTEAPVTCKICGKTVKTKECLRSHMSHIHNPSISVRTCEYCGQTFKDRKGHMLHVQRRHTTGIIKKYKCSFCDKAFIDNHDRKRHIQSHTGERPYLCEYCKKGFSSSHALKTHIRQHTKEKPYKCAHCVMAFPQRVSLRTHIKSKHPEKFQEIRQVDEENS